MNSPNLFIVFRRIYLETRRFNISAKKRIFNILIKQGLNVLLKRMFIYLTEFSYA